jgi:S-layer protein
VDSFPGTAGNDTFTATGATFGAQDVITGGTGADKLVIADTTSASAAGLAAATITGVETLEVASNAGIGAFVKTGNAAAAGTAQTATITYTASTAATESITIQGVTYTSATLIADLTGANAATAVTALINAALGASVASAAIGVITITSPFAGTPLPALSLSGAGGTESAAGVAAGTANVEKVLATGAQAQIVNFTLSNTGHASDNSYTIYIDGVNRGTVLAGVDTTSAAGKATGAAVIAAEINKVLPGQASSTGAVVNIASLVAGTPLPIISVVTGGTSNTVTRAAVRDNADAVTADTAAVVYNAAGFADAFTANGAGDMNVKAASTAAVSLNNTSGKIVVDTAKTVNIVTTGTGTTDVTGKTLESVSIKGGGNVTVDNLLNTSAATTAAGTSMTTATLTGIAGTTAALKGAALSTVNITSQTSGLTTTVTNGTSKAMTLNLTAAGYNSSGTAQTNRVDAGAAAEAITVNTVSKSNVDVRGAAVTALTLTGAGELTADVSNLATRSITSTATGDLILGTLNAATTSVTTGAGADSFTLGTAVKTVRVSTGEGKDVVTVGQLVAGATVDLGAGDDKILGSAVVEAKTVTDPGMIDGGAGTDTISSLLLNQGNASRFANFEVLGLATASATFDAALVPGVAGLELLVANSGVYTGVTKEMGLAVNANIGTGSTTLTYAAANVVGTNDSMTVTFGAKGATTSTSSSRTSIDGGTLVVEGIEHVNIVSNQASGFVNNTIDLTSAKLKTVTITGNAAETTLGFTGTVGTNGSTAGSGGAVSLIDASSVSGIVTVSTAGITADDSAAGLTVKTGSGKDVITLRHLTTVDAGAGDDSIVLEVDTTAYNSANSVLTGGAGKDAFNVSAAVFGTDGTATGGINDTIASIIVTITDYAAGDTIDFSAGTEDAETLGAAVSTATATTLNGAITDIIVGAGTTHFAWGVYAGNTYVVHNADKGNGTDAAAEAGDVVVKLSGVYDLSLGAFSTGGVLSLA